MQSEGWTDLYGPLLVMAAIIAAVILVFVRGGRNQALEDSLAHDEFGPATAFRGTLLVEENRRGEFLSMARQTAEARWLQFWYRWIVGSGPPAVFDQVTFDGARRTLEMKKKDHVTELSFSECAAVRMKERAGRGVSLWNLDVLKSDGKAIPLVASVLGERKSSFERSAAVAKAMSEVIGVPVQVSVAGNVWTPGWPPKPRVS